MALSATIYRFGIDLSDMNRHIYERVSLHVALHPSETIERMCARLVAFALSYEEHLEFTKGLSTDDEPDIWKVNYSSEIEHWIEIGKPDAKRLKKALGRSKNVSVFSYGGQDVEQWIESILKDASVNQKISAFRFDKEPVEQLASLVERTMELGIMIQDDLIHVSFDGNMIEFKLETLMGHL